MPIFSTELPGNNRAYGVRRSQGPRYLIGGMVVSQYARGAETEDGFSLSLLTGGAGSGLPILKHQAAQVCLYVVDGVIELMIGTQALRLEKGDYASVPEGAAYGFRMNRVRNVVLTFQTGGDSGKLFSTLGSPYAGYVQPEGKMRDASRIDIKGVVSGCDTEILAEFPAEFSETSSTATDLPVDKCPYALRAGEGERLVVADQLFAYLGKNQHSDARFFTLLTEGPAGKMVPPHHHEKHTECFFCLEGSMTMIAGENTFDIGPGDFVHVTPGTIHGYQLNAPYTQFIGFLTPGVFENFFAILGEPYDAKVYPQTPHPFEFGRVLARLDELDLVPAGKPEN